MYCMVSQLLMCMCLAPTQYKSLNWVTLGLLLFTALKIYLCVSRQAFSVYLWKQSTKETVKSLRILLSAREI